MSELKRALRLIAVDSFSRKFKARECCYGRSTSRFALSWLRFELAIKQYYAEEKISKFSKSRKLLDKDMRSSHMSLIGSWLGKKLDTFYDLRVTYLAKEGRKSEIIWVNFGKQNPRKLSLWDDGSMHAHGLVYWTCLQWAYFMKVEYVQKKNLWFLLLFSGLFRDVQSVCLSVTWRAEEKKQQPLEGKVRVKRQTNHSNEGWAAYITFLVEKQTNKLINWVFTFTLVCSYQILIWKCRILSVFQTSRDSVTSLEQTVVPHHDYFSAQFLLSFNLPTVYHVTVNSSVIDSSGIQWNTGPQSSLQVKTSDTAARKQRTSRS